MRVKSSGSSSTSVGAAARARGTRFDDRAGIVFPLMFIIISNILGSKQEWLPISVRSWSALRVVYSLSHHTWTTKGFAFTATYAFNTDEVCGHNILTETAGETRSVKLSVNALKLNHFYHLDCSWLLNAKMEGQISLEMETNQNRPCTAWNLSVLYHETDTSDETGDLAHTFCPRDIVKSYSLPWRLGTVLLRLRAMTRTLPEYVLRWRSQSVFANTRVSGPTTAPEQSAACLSARATYKFLSALSLLVLVVYC
uniref:Uncharacterized protein n=1 Tax=Timema douglasi TaxID=61478 RepID=A0A7R8VYH4_TIMDO|nr:unnamed protein product [Timema douglasi]